jgi:putative membrane protein
MNLLKHTTVACTALAVALASSALAAEKEHEKDKVSAMDKAWAHMAAVSDKAELTLAKVAESKGESQEVKQHAQRMTQDHTKTTDELKKWASANHVELNADLPPEKHAVIKEIESKSGAEFDRAYMNHEVEAHRHAAVHFQNGVEFVMNPELKQFAQENQPVINQHLAMAEQQAGAQHTNIAGSNNGGASGQGAAAGQSQSGNASAGAASGGQGAASQRSSGQGAASQHSSGQASSGGQGSSNQRSGGQGSGGQGSSGQGSSSGQVRAQ